MYFTIDKKYYLELYTGTSKSAIKISMIDFVNEILNLDLLSEFNLHYKRNASQNAKNYLSGKLSETNIELINQVEPFPIPLTFLMLDDLLYILSRCDWLFGENFKESEDKIQYEINHLVNRITLFSPSNGTTIEMYDHRFISTLDMLAHDVSYSVVEELAEINKDEADKFFSTYIDDLDGLDPEILRINLKSKDFSEFLCHFNLSTKQFNNLSINTQKHLQCLFSFVNTETPIKRLTADEEKRSIEDHSWAEYRGFIEFAYLSPCLFENFTLENRLMLFEYINECKKKYIVKNVELYAFDKDINTLLYFCILYLKKHNIAKFKRCKYCGKISSQDSCPICKIESGEAENAKKKFNGKIRTSKTRFLNKLNDDPMLSFRQKECLKNYYNNFLNSINLLYEEVQNLSVRQKTYSHIYNEILTAKAKAKADFGIPSTTFNEIEGIILEDFCIHQNLNSVIDKIEELFLTPNEFYKFITDISKIYIIDELIDKLNKLIHENNLRTKLNIESLTNNKKS